MWINQIRSAKVLDPQEDLEEHRGHLLPRATALPRGEQGKHERLRPTRAGFTRPAFCLRIYTSISFNPHHSAFPPEGFCCSEMDLLPVVLSLHLACRKSKKLSALSVNNHCQMITRDELEKKKKKETQTETTALKTYLEKTTIHTTGMPA